MRSHSDDDHTNPPAANDPDRARKRAEFMRELEIRADTIRSLGKSKMTGGADDEPVLARWDKDGVGVIHRPNDPQGVLRVSVGGGEDLPVSLTYLVFRGDREACARLLERALAVLKAGPPAVESSTPATKE